MGQQLREAILEIGGQMVVCAKDCEGIVCEQREGILPRCLILEDDGKSGDKFSHSLFPHTVRRCVANYLHRELEACPPTWMAIGVGREAFAALSLVCPNRFVMGVPHCTGQYANRFFDELFDGEQLLPRIMQEFQELRDVEPTGALWLTANGSDEPSFGA